MLNTMKLTHVLLTLIILILTFPSQTHAQQAILSLSPSAITVQNGQIISATVILNTENDTIDRALAKITYTSGILSPQSINTSSSFVTIWYTVDTTSNNSALILEGGVSGNGVSGTNLIFATINFVARAEGVATVAFASDSAVYLAGSSTNILVQSQTATYTVGSVSTPTPTRASSTITPTATPTPLPNELPKGGNELYSILVGLSSSFVILCGFLLVLKK